MFIDENKFVAGKNGAIEIIVNVMKAYSNSEKVCLGGCNALVSITNISGNTFVHF